MNDKVNSDYYISPLWGKRIENPDDVYKGDGITSCKWCGGTGWMHTWGLMEFYNDAPCICELGQKVLEERKKNG